MEAAALPFRTAHSPFGRVYHAPPKQDTPVLAQADEDRVDQSQQENSEASFLANTPKTGLLKVETFLADRAAPIAGVNILVSKIIDGREHVFYNAQTNEVGILNDIRLPAPDAATSLSPDQPFPYATYVISAAKRGFFLVPPTEIQIFEGIKTIQQIPMRFDFEGGIDDAAL